MRTIGAAAVAAAMALGMAPSAIGASIHDGYRTGRGGGSRKLPPLRKTARERVPKSLRQYAKRYAKKSPSEVLSMHARFPAPMLDHWRDRREALRKALGR